MAKAGTMFCVVEMYINSLSTFGSHQITMTCKSTIAIQDKLQVNVGPTKKTFSKQRLAYSL